MSANATPMLEVRDMEMRFSINSGLIDRLRIDRKGLHLETPVVNAVNGVSFRIQPGEVMALVGESGCGKSTVAKTIARIYAPTGGDIQIEGENIANYGFAQMLPVRAKMQMIFQDPYASLNPRQRVRDIVAEPLLEQTKTADERRQIPDKIEALLAKVGLNAEHAGRYPHQFSGGQRQRIGIARALSVKPGLIIADRVGVMYLGFMVENAPRDVLFSNPRHPYTKALLSAAPSIKPKRAKAEISLQGEVPSALNLPSGCCFRTRCPFAWERCAAERPKLQSVGDDQTVACHLVDEPGREK